MASCIDGIIDALHLLLRGVLLFGIKCLLPFKDACDVPRAVENSNDADGVLFEKVINADSFESRDGPRPQVLEPRGARPVLRTDTRMLAQPLNSPPHGLPEARASSGRSWSTR
jgi:hypothetical protein